ncbi:MAG TPA: patatin-like phospholipase family protein, partial [Myxococcota bacterium]|nr:patatin-like phospholipase family protein [Myxococcota bacterium]
MANTRTNAKRDAAAPRRIGLALGGGAARGWAHVGVLEALEEAGIRPGCIAGTSIGALIGAIYASGGIDGVRALVQGVDWKRMLALVDPVLPRTGLIDGRRVEDLVRAHVREPRIEDLPIPFAAVATDLTTATEVVI